MRRRSLPADKGLRGSLIQRLEEASAWINPFLMAIATMLFITDLSCGVALIVTRLPITHIAAPPTAAEDAPHGIAPMAVQ